MGRIWRTARKGQERRPRRALWRDAGVFVLGFALTVCGGLAFTAGSRPPEWLGQPRSEPLIGRVHVVDGDTLRVGGERIRIASIDAPEMPPHARCATEAALAFRAKANLERMVASGSEYTLVPNFGRERDVYGRLLGRVLIDGEDVGQAQLEAGLAQPWMGHHAVWC